MVAQNNLGYCFLQWTPTYYNEILKVSNVAAGKLLRIQFWAAFVQECQRRRCGQGP